MKTCSSSNGSGQTYNRSAMLRRDFLIQTLLSGAAASAASLPARIPMGLNTYCLRALKWNDAQLLDYCASLKLDAIFLQDSLDPEVMEPSHWRAVKDSAVKLGLHLETGGGA